MTLDGLISLGACRRIKSHHHHTHRTSGTTPRGCPRNALRTSPFCQPGGWWRACAVSALYCLASATAPGSLRKTKSKDRPAWANATRHLVAGTVCALDGRRWPYWTRWMDDATCCGTWNWSVCVALLGAHICAVNNPLFGRVWLYDISPLAPSYYTCLAATLRFIPYLPNDSLPFSFTAFHTSHTLHTCTHTHTAALHHTTFTLPHYRLGQ
jgi:hypothetical protein